MKKILSFFLSVALFIPATIPTVAYASSEVSYAAMSTEELAYCDLDYVAPAWQNKVLEARDEVIHSTSWTVDGIGAILHSDGTIEELPEFYDVFPDDWAIPESGDVSPTIQTRVAKFAGYVYLANPINDESPAFYTFNSGTLGTAARIFEYDTTFKGTSWNVAFDDITRGLEVIHLSNIPTSQSGYLKNPVYGNKYGVRASTYSTPGNAFITVGEYVEL